MRPGPLIAAALLLACAVARAEPLSPRVIERYKQMLAANPVEGVALERLWKGALEAGTTEELLAEYRKAGSAAAKLILGHLLRKSGREDEALGAYEAAAKLEPANALPALAMGRMESDRARPQEAAAWLERAIGILGKDDPRLLDALMQLGAAWSVAGEAAKAADVWERTVAMAPNDLELRRRLAGACSASGRPELAIGHLEFLAERAEPAGRAQALQQIGRLHSAAGRFAEGMEAFERAMRITAPESWLRGELLGQIIRLAQRRHAEVELEKKWLAEVDVNPRDLGGYLKLVEFYDQTGNLDQQRAWLERVMSMTPKNAAYGLRLARLLTQTDLLDEAVTHYERLLASQPGNTGLIFERARLDLRREDGAAARQRMRAMLGAHRDDASLRSRALEFFQEHKLLDMVEEHLRADAETAEEEAVIALAEFYFSQRRNDEARAAMNRMIRSGDAPEIRAQRHLRIAQHLKGHGELTPAVGDAEAAAKLLPESRDAHLLLGELRAVLLQSPEARAAYGRAFALSQTDAERIEVDGKLFENIRAAAMHLKADGRQGSSPAAQVESFIRELMGMAGEAKSPAGWLRVARWKAWNNDRASAVTFAAKAADMEPKNPVAREFLARHAATNGELPYAIVYLREVIGLNPAGRDGYLREIAQLELQRGNAKDALEILAGLAKANPASVDALADLAAAQERAGMVKDAVVTWRKTFLLAPVPRRREVGASLLRALELVGLHEEGAELLLRGMEETGDERARFARLDELLLYCQRHDRLGWLREIFEKRRKGRADDYFVAIALGRILKLSGEKAAAFEMFADAIFSMPNQADALPELVREAEELRKLDVAVRLQEQFIRIGPAERSDGYLRLAVLQEAGGDLEGAERSWTQAVAKFPRDADVLRKAADFHRQWGDRGTVGKLLGKLHALDRTDVRVASEVGEARFAERQFAEAQAAFEAVMKLTRPVAQMVFPSGRDGGPWSESGPVPESWLRGDSKRGPASLPARSVGKLGAPGRTDSESELRLGAIRCLAEIAQRTGGAALEQWIASWNGADAGQPTDALWALFFAGAREQALSLVEQAALRDRDGVACRQAFVRMAFESGMFARLGAWVNAPGRTGEEAEMFSSAFAQSIKTRPEMVTPAMMRGLFPEGAAARLWPSAIELARNNHPREAIMLGRRVVDRAVAQRAGYRTEVARWHLALGEVNEARELLEAACEGAAESFDSPVYAAMRELYFLLPPEERAASVQQRIRRVAEGTVHGLITRVLLFGLEGRGDEARGALARLAALRPIGSGGRDASNSALREWTFVASTGTQLIEWNLPELARHALDLALGDVGLRALQELQAVREGAPSIESRGEPWSQRSLVHDAAREVRAQRDALAYLACGRVERERMLAERQRQPDEAGLSRLAEAIEAVRGGAGAAVAVYRRWWENEPENPAALRKLIESSRAAGDMNTAEAVRRRCLDEGINPGNDTTPREFALELAELLDARGATGEALAVIAKAIDRHPEELRLLHRQAQLLEQTGRADDAANVWGRLAALEGGTAYGRAALAAVFEHRGDFRAAIDVRMRAGSSGDTQLPVLLYKDGKIDEALTAMERLSGTGAVQGALALAEALALQGETRSARSVLIAAATKTTEPRALLQVRAKLLTIPGLAPGAVFLGRMQSRMRVTARLHPELAEGYFEFFEHYARRLGIEKNWSEELIGAWADGNGDEAAGIVLLRRALGSGDFEAAQRNCERLLARPDLSDAMIGKLGVLARQARRAELQLLLAEAKARRSWPLADGMFEWVRLLDANGHRERAREVLAQHAWLASMPGGAEALGRAWLAVGDPAQARTFLSLAMKESAAGPSPSVLAAMARAHLPARNFKAARLLLGRAFAEPGCHEYDALVEYLAATGDLMGWRRAVEEFRLPARSVHELERVIFSTHEKGGRVTEALALLADDPGLVRRIEGFRVEDAGGPPIDCQRVRRLVEKGGGFSEVAAALKRMAASGAPDAAAELAALRAARAEKDGGREQALGHWEHAAGLRRTSWEFARRVAEIRLAVGQPEKAKAAIEQFLRVSHTALEREAALDLWETANEADRGRKAGS